jgi:hypothetical protein
MGEDAAERAYRSGLWMIQFTAPDGQHAQEYARRGADGEVTLEVTAAGQYGFAAVGTHRQVIALRDVVMADGESFAITRAIMAELYPGGALVTYRGGHPAAFCEQALTRLGFDPAADPRWDQARQFQCPARLLDAVLADPDTWHLRQQDDDQAAL